MKGRTPPVGSGRSTAGYVWPTKLSRQSAPPKMVYLDLNHWIALAKAYAGHPDGARHEAELRSLLRASETGAAVFPISDAIYTEISKIGAYRQRRDLRQVIEQLSGYVVVTSRSVVATHEIEAMLDNLVGPNPDPVNLMPYQDWGVARAFGKVGGFRVKSATGEDQTNEVRAGFTGGPGAFDAILAAAELELQRRVLDGPAPDEEAYMRSLGWNPRSSMEIADRRATQEVEQVARFNAHPSWRRGRIRDVVAARELIFELNDLLTRGLVARGTTVADVITSPEEGRQVFDAMPSFDVAVSLKTSYHRDPNHRWTPNDVHDIDALASTVPYCDVVVTDNAVVHHAERSGLPERLGTVLLSHLSDLVSEI
jgi:hypothetical protein